MASDEIVWQIINQQFCSFKLKTPKNQTFCRNTDNVTGLCNRQSCPLANSRYATIRSSPTTKSGKVVLYLCMKTIERAHTPAKLWERIKLSTNYAQAMAQIDARLQFWPKFLVHKCKQRLTRLTQVAIRTRRLEKEEERLGETVVSKVAPKIRRREATRERKAEAAARVERAIERELVERLRSGAYGDRPLNVEEGVWKKVLRGLERGGEGERDRDLDEGVEEEEEEEEEEEDEWEREKEMEMEDDGVGAVEYVSDIDEDEESVGDLEEWLGGESGEEESGSEDDGSDHDSGSGEEDFTTKKKADNGVKRKRNGEQKAQRKTKPRMEIEYEHDVAAPEREAVLAR